MRMRSAARITTYGIVMAATVAVDVLLIVWLFTNAGARVSIAFLVFGAWTIPVIAHVVGKACTAPHRSASHVSATSKEKDWTDPDLPWGTGRILGAGASPARQGSFGTGYLGLAFFERRKVGSSGEEPLRIPWEQVRWTAVVGDSDPAPGSPVGTSHDGGPPAIVGTLHPSGIETDDADFVIFMNQDCPRRAWETLLADGGIHVVTGAESVRDPKVRSTVDRALERR
ncbi:MAG TPA: hypothetical protein VII96_11820 [Acidimicrobiales bacterium]